LSTPEEFGGLPRAAAAGEAPHSERLDAELPDPIAHLEFAHAQLNDSLVARWHGGPRPVRGVESMLVAQAAQAEETGYTLWWWRERSSGELVGYVGLNRDEVEDEPIVEVGWSISPRRWGEGLAPEAARAALEWGFERCGLERIVAFTLVDNERSQRVTEKIGMHYVREFERGGLPHLLYEIRRG
jgi:ribosomal-protein-alanine N-acetyltransferase